MTTSTAHRRRVTFRARLTLTFTALVATAGIAIVLIVAVFMRTIPSYVTIAVLGDDAADRFSAPARLPENPSDVAQPTGLQLRSPADILNANLLVSVVVLVVIVAAAAAIAWMLSGRILRPLHAVNEAARRAGRGAFDHRLNVTGPRDEVRELADTFDEMLARLDRSFSAAQRFAANASHELQTPLATTQTMLDVALADPRASADDLRAVAERVRETNRRSIETVSALLDLAELRERDLEHEAVDLVPLLRAAISDESRRIEQRGLRIDDELSTAVVVGDAVLLRQAVSNLVHNAVRHNIDHGSIRVFTEDDGDRLGLVIENTGAEVSEDALNSLTEPFVRGTGRIAGEGGHGLGLAIVDSIARTHGGTLELRPNPGGGLIVRLILHVQASQVR